jgi:hypothetical protein
MDVKMAFLSGDIDTEIHFEAWLKRAVTSRSLLLFELMLDKEKSIVRHIRSMTQRGRFLQGICLQELRRGTHTGRI